MAYLTAADLDARNLLRAALDVSTDGFAVHRVRRDGAGRVVGFTLEMINRAGAVPLGTTPEALVGLDVAELLGPSSGPMIDAFRRCAETGMTQKVRTTFSESPLAGTTDSIVVRLDENHLMSTWRDVTEHIVSEQLLEEALRHRSEAWHQLRSVLDAMSDAVVVVRVDGVPTTAAAAARSQITYVNETAATALGASASLVPPPWLDEVVGEGAVVWLGTLILRAVTATSHVSERVIVLDVSGRVQDARLVTARAMSDGQVLLVSRDVTHEEWSIDEV